MSDPMLEIEEIFEQIVKGENVTRDDCAEAQARFKYAFLTVDSKEEFLPFLAGYLGRLAEVFGPDDERVSALRQEVEGFYHKIPELISLFHLAGFKDPNDKDDSRPPSDIDDSFDEDHKIAKMSHFLNFQIPEDKKPLVTKVLQNVAVLSDQKKATRVQLFTKWRYMCLAQKISAYRVYVPALFTIQKFCARKFNYLSRLKQAVLTPPRKRMEETAAGADRSSVDGVGSDALMADFNNKLKEKEDQILALREKLRLMANGTQDAGVLEIPESEVEERVRGLRDRIAALEARVLELASDNEAKKLLLADHMTQLLEKRELTERLSNELRQLKKEQSKDVLSRFNKVRFLVNTLRHLSLKFMQTGFNRLHKRAIRTADAIQNVSLRMKARLLDQTRSLHCGRDMHRNFLKWYIRTDKFFLKELVTKVLINCRITSNIAFYRMKKMAFRPQKLQLSDAMKVLYRCKASNALHNLFSAKVGGAMKQFFDTINPHKKTAKEAAIESLLLHRLPFRLKAAKKVVMNKFLRRLALEKRTLHEISGYWKARTRAALDRLKDLLRQRRTIDALNKVRRGTETLQGLISRRGRDFVDRLKKLGGKSLLQTLEKLASATRFKQLAALSVLKHLYFQGKLEKKTVEFASDVIDLRKKALAQLMVAALKKKAYQALTELRLFREEEDKRAERNRQLGQRVMINLNDRLKLLKGQALAKLREFRLDQIGRQRRQQMALGVLANAGLQKQKAAVGKLTENFQIQKFRDATQRLTLGRLFNQLAIRSQAKCRLAVEALRKNRETQQAREAELRKGLLARLVQAQQGKVRGSLQKLRAQAAEFRTNQAKQEKLKSTLRLLADGPRTNMAEALRMLRQNSKRAVDVEADRRNKLNTMAKRLVQAQAGKQAEGLRKLREVWAAGRTQEEQKMRKIADLLSKMNRKNTEKVSRSMNELRQVNQEAKKEADRKKEIQRRLLTNLAKAAEERKRIALDRLVQNGHQLRQQEATKTRVLGKLADNLKRVGRSKAEQALSKLGAWAKAHQSQEKDRNTKLASLWAQMARKAADRQALALEKLRANRLREMEKEAALRRKKAYFANMLLRAEDKRRVALNKLRTAAAQLAAQERNRLEKIRAAVEKIVAASRQKQERTLFLLTSLYSRAKFLEDLERLKASYGKSAEERRKRGLLMLLVSSQTGKMLNCLNGLIRWANSCRIAEAKKKDRCRNAIQRLVESNQGKLETALNRLTAHKNAMTALERDLAAKNARKTAILGGGAKGQSQFQALMKGLKQPKGPREKDYGFASLVDFMKENNRRGKFDPLLTEVGSGEIANTHELLKEAVSRNLDNRFDDLIARINDRNREAKDVLRFMKAANTDGKLGKFIEVLENNPKLTKAEIVDFVSKNNKDGGFDGLKSHLDGQKKVDELTQWMRRNNQDGAFEKELAYLRRLKDPKLSDLIHIVGIDKGAHLLPLKEQLTREDGQVTVAKLLDDLRATNDKGQFNDALEFAQKERVPTLSDMVLFCRANNSDGRYNPVLKAVDGETRDPAVETILHKLEDANEGDRLTPLIQELRATPRLTKANLLLKAQSGNRGDASAALARILDEGNPAAKYLSWASQNNPEGVHDQLLAAHPNHNQARLSEVIAFCQKRENSEALRPLLDQINSQESLKSLRRFVQTDLTGPEFQGLRRFLDANPKGNVAEIVGYALKNNAGDRMAPLLDHIDRKRQEDFGQKLLRKIGQRNINGRFGPVLAEVKSQGLSKATEISQALARHNHGVEFLAIDSPEAEAITAVVDALEGSGDGHHQEIIQKISDQPSATLSEVVSIVRSANKPSATRIFDLLNVFANQVDHMRRNNASGQFDEVLSHLEEQENPKLHHLLDYLTTNNHDSRYNGLLAKIDSEFNRNRLQAYLASDADRFEAVNSHLVANPQTTIGELLALVNQLNHDGRLDGIVAVIDGDGLPKSAGQVIEFMQQNNQSGKFGPILERLGKVESPTVSQVVGEIETENKNHQLDDAIDFFDGVNRGALTAPLQYLRNNNQSGRFNVLLEKAESPDFKVSDLMAAVAVHPQKERLADFQDVLDNRNGRNLFHTLQRYMRENNADGKYTQLLGEVAAGKTPNLFDLASAILANNGLTHHKELTDILDETPKDLLARDLLTYARLHNEEGKFSGFLEAMRHIKQPRLTDMVPFIVAHNQDERFDPLLDMINGNSFPVNRLLEFLLANNADGKYNGLVDLLRKNPDASASAIMDESRRFGPNSELDDFLKFLGEGGLNDEGLGDVESDDLFKFLANARRKNQIPEVLKSIEEEDIKSTEQLVDFLRSHNSDGKYDGILQRVLGFSQAVQEKEKEQQTKEEPKGLSLLRPAKEKMRYCLARLRESAKEEALAHKMKMLKVAAVLQRIKLKARAKQLKAVETLSAALRGVRQSGKLKQTRLARLFGDLLDRKDAKLREAMRTLQTNWLRRSFAERRKADKTKEALGRLAIAAQAKQATVLKALRENTNKNVKKLAQFAARFLSIQEKKKGLALQKLRQNAAQLQRRQTSGVKLAGLLANKQRQRMVASIQNLKMESVVGAAKANVASIKRNGVIEKFANGIKLALRQSLARLRENAKHRQLQQVKRNAKLAGLFGKLARASRVKCRIALVQIRNVAKQAQSRKLQALQKTAAALQKLSTNYQAKAGKALVELKRHKDEKVATQSKAKVVLGRWRDRILAAQRLAYNALVANAKAARLQEKKKAAVLASLDTTLRKKQANSALSALQALKSFAAEKAKENERKNGLVQKVLGGLVGKNQAKARQFLTIAQEGLRASKLKEDLQKARLKGVLSRLMRHKIISAFERLALHNLQTKLRTLQRRMIASKLKGASLTKFALTIGKLRHFQAVRSLKMKHNVGVLNSLLTGAIRNRQAAVIGEINRKVVRQSARQEAAARLIRKHLLEKQRSAFGKLQDLAAVARRNKFNNALSSMMYCLNKNHKVCKRAMLDVWSQKELKEKTRKFASALANLINKRTAFALAKIKQEYHMWKYQKVLKGLMKTVETVDLINTETKRKALKDMYNMFIDNNPWFKRVISILAMNTKLTDQVSFWRMRHVKNLKREGVSPMLAIKMKKFLAVFKKQETKNLSWGFWNLTKAMDTMPRVSK